MNRETMKTQLQILIERYNRTTRLETKENVSEETIRTWLNEFLGLFGWDVQNTHEVLQERCLRGTAGERLREIWSTDLISNHFWMRKHQRLILSTINK